MEQLLVRNLEAQLKQRLKRRAQRHGRSMEEEARDILRNALREEDTPGTGLGTDIAALFSEIRPSNIGLEEAFPELRGYLATPATFEP
jgi:plasmid stability protein